jgi:hypothetical protein
MTTSPGYVMDRIRSAIGATVVLSVLGFSVAGCTSSKPDPDPPCDPAKRQEQGMASLSSTGCPSFVRPTYNSDH